MTERAYLLIISVVFLLFTLGNVLQFIFIPWALEPAWPGLIAAAVTGFLSFEGFHFAHKLPPKGWNRGTAASSPVVRAGPASPFGLHARALY